MIVLSDEQVHQLARVDEIIAAIRAAFARDFSATLRMPVRTSLDLAEGVLLLMPAFDSLLNAAGVKTVTVTATAGVNARYELLDPKTGETLARMEANWLTDLRTAATSAVATDLLARQDVQTLGVFGSGRQARAHLLVLPAVRRFSRFLVCGSARSHLGPFCAEMSSRHGISVEPVDAHTCARESDVICTCTTSRVPLFDGQWLKPGTHLNLVGTFQPDAREVDDETVRRARVVVDTYQGALAEAADLLIPMGRNVIRKDHVIADLHQLASGKKLGRLRPGDLTLFKSVGCALEDLVAAQAIYQRASQ